MTRIGLVIRLLMLLACLVPFTNTRQAAVACAPLLPIGATNHGGPLAPFPGPQEDDTEREEQADGKEKQRVSHHRPGEADPPRRTPRLRLPHTTAAHHNHVPAPLADPDPFRNGLGTPYRC